jgi:hypothetical protein
VCTPLHSQDSAYAGRSAPRARAGNCFLLNTDQHHTIMNTDQHLLFAEYWSASYDLTITRNDNSNPTSIYEKQGRKSWLMHVELSCWSVLKWCADSCVSVRRQCIRKV